MQSTFEARYAGPCASCTTRIEAGDEVMYTADDRLVHAQCDPTAAVDEAMRTEVLRSKAAPRVCRGCFITLPLQASSPLCDECA